MNTYKLLLTVITIIVGACIVVPKSYAAQQSLRISPVIINVSLSPGKETLQDATIENLTDAPLPLRATLNDFMTSGEEGGYTFEDSKENPLLSWIKLSDTDFILNPKEKKTIHLQIKTPQTIPVGGYYGILFFEPVVQDTISDSTKISSKIGILLLANIGVNDPHAKKADILAFDTNAIYQEGTIPFILRVKNVALNFFTAKPSITITPLLGLNSQAKPIYLEEKIIFPGKVRRWTEENVIQNLSPNIYHAKLILSSGNGQMETQDRYFVVFPYIKVLIIILGLLLLLLIIVKRKALREALSILVHK